MRLSTVRNFGLGVFLAVSLHLPVAAHADVLDNWNVSNVITNPAGFKGFQLRSVVWGNGRYVAVGFYINSDIGEIQTSEDGVNWTVRSPECCSILDLFDVVFGNGRFVAVGWGGLGYQSLYCSTNGIDWVSTNGLISNFYTVTYGNGVFVAGGDQYLWAGGGAGVTNRNIYTSTNGINWTDRNSGSPANDPQTISDVAFGNGRFIAVDYAHHFYTAGNGSFWTRSTNSNAGTRISFCNGLFFVASGPGSNLVSADGLSWSMLTNNTGQAFQRIVFSSGIYLALSQSNLFSSTDGTNWIQRSLPATNIILTDIVIGSHNAIVLGVKIVPWSPSTRDVPVGFITDPFVSLSADTSFPPGLNVSGLVGRSYRIEYVTDLRSNDWQPLTTFPLLVSPSTWIDSQATNTSRFYRAVLLP
jgi:hypothetical protein